MARFCFRFILSRETINEQSLESTTPFCNSITNSRKRKDGIMKKFEKFVFLSNYRLRRKFASRGRDAIPPCRHVAAEIIRLENESVTSNARAGIKADGREIRSAAPQIPGKNLRRGAPDKTRKQPRTRLQLPPRGTNCAAGSGNEVAPFVLHAKSI